MTIAPHQLQVHICTFVVTKYQLLLLQLKSSRQEKVSEAIERAAFIHCSKEKKKMKKIAATLSTAPCET